MLDQFIVELPNGRKFQTRPPNLNPTEADAGKYLAEQCGLKFDLVRVYRVKELIASAIEEMFPSPVKP